MAGAVLIGDNLVGTELFDEIETIGGLWEDTEELLSPQLRPAARSVGGSQNVVGLAIQATGAPPGGVNAIGLLGLNDHPLSTLRIDQRVGGDWVGVAQPSVYELRSVATRHIVVLIGDPDLDADGWRVRFNGQDHPVEIGSVLAGRYITAPDLADEGWSQEYQDRAGSQATEGGQIYSETTETHRVVRIPQQTVEPITMLGVVPHGRSIELPTPDLQGAVTKVDDGWGNDGAGGAGALTYPNQLAQGQWYRLDYTARYHGPGTPGAEPPWRLEQQPPETIPYTPDANRLAAGSHTMIFRRDSSATSLRFEHEIMVSDNHVWMRVDRISEIDPPPAIWAADQTLAGFIARHGTTREILFLPHPSDPMTNRNTGIYGRLRDPVRATDRGGQLTATTLTIEEQR